VFSLQRTIGNAAVCRLLGNRNTIQRDPETDEAKAAADAATLSFKESFTKLGALGPSTQEDLKANIRYRELARAAKPPLTTAAQFRAQKSLADYGVEWLAARTARKAALVSPLQAVIGDTVVPGRFGAAFKLQLGPALTAVNAAAEADEAARVGDFNVLAADLSASHKKVADLENETGAQLGSTAIRAILAAIETQIQAATVDSGPLDIEIGKLRTAVGLLGRSARDRMVEGQKAMSSIAGHPAAGKDPLADVRGKVEEAAALKGAKATVTGTKQAVVTAGTGIDNDQLAALKKQSSLLKSFRDRTKEKAAHDLKEKFEAGPYFLDPAMAKIVHADRHLFGRTGDGGFKNAGEIQQDYLGESKKQYKATKETWYKYLGYSGTGNPRLYWDGSAYGGKPGHNTVFGAPYDSSLLAASDTFELKTPASFLNTLYPSSGMMGAHYSLEFDEPRPAAFRGGATKPGNQYYADGQSGSATWTNAEAHMTARQAAEEARVTTKITDAFDEHLVPVAKLNPNRRVTGIRPDHVPA